MIRASTRLPWLAAISFLGGVAVTFWVLRDTGVDPREALRHVSPTGHLLALAAFSVELAARGIRIAFVARGLGVPLTLSTSLGAQVAGDALGSVTPSRAGSDPAKLWWLRRGGVDMGTGGALLLAEILLEASCLLAVAVLVALGPADTRWVALGLVGYAGLVVGVATVVVVIVRRTGTRDSDRFLGIRIGAGRLASLRALAATLEDRAKALRHLPGKHLAGAFATTMLHIGARAAVLPALLGPAVSGTGGLLGMLGVTLSPRSVLVPLFLLYGTALLPPPGGGGSVEAAFALLLSDSIGEFEVGATVVWWRLYTFYLSAMLGGLLLAVSATRLDTDRSRDARRDGTACGTPM